MPIRKSQEAVLACFPLSAAQAPFASHVDPISPSVLGAHHIYPSTWSPFPTKPSQHQFSEAVGWTPAAKNVLLVAVLCISYWLSHTASLCTEGGWAPSSWHLHIHFVTVWIWSGLCKRLICWRFGSQAMNCSVVGLWRSDCTLMDPPTHGFVTWWHYWWGRDGDW